MTTAMPLSGPRLIVTIRIGEQTRGTFHEQRDLLYYSLKKNMILVKSKQNMDILSYVLRIDQ